MKLPYKVLSGAFIASIAAAAFVAPTPNQVEAAEVNTLDTVILNSNGQKLVVSLLDYATALFDKEGSLYNLTQSSSIHGVGAGDKYIDINAYAQAFFDKDGNVEASIEASEAITSADLASFEVVTGFDENGKPVTKDLDVKGALEVVEISAVTDITVTEGDDVALPPEVNVTFNDGTTGTKDVTWDKTGADFAKAGTYTLTGAIEGTDKTASVKVVVNAKALQVESVSANNLKTVVVNFSTEVEKDSATKEANYTIIDKDGNGVGVYDAVLSSDKKSVTLVAGNNTSTAAFANGSDYKVVVKAVKDAKGTVIADTEKAFSTPTDVNVPQVDAVEMLGNKVLKVKFSEPVVLPADDAGNHDFEYAVKGTSSYTTVTTSNATVVQSADLKEVTITFNSQLATGDFVLRTKKDTTLLKDFAGYEVPVTSKDFSVGTTTTVGQVDTVEVGSRTEVTVKFDSAVVAPAATTLYWNTNGVESSDSSKATSVKKVDDKTYVYTFSGSNVLPTGKVFFFVKGASDAYGNAVPTKKVEATVAEEAKATATVAAKDDDNIVVTFSKTMDEASAEKVANYTIKDKDGKAVTISSATYDADKKTVTLAVSDLRGDYKVSVKDVKDAVGTVVTELVDVVVAVTDTTSPANASIATDTNGTNKFSITYPEAMAVTGVNSIANLDNYKLSLNGTYEAMPTGTTATVSADGKTVLFTLPAGKVVTDGVSSVKVGYIDGTKLYTVADAAGNAIDTVATNKTIASKTAPSINSAALKIKDSKTLELAFANAPLAEVEANDFNITLDNFATSFTAASAELKDGKIYLTLPSDKEIKATTDITGVKVKTELTPANINTKTALGIKITENQTSAAASVTPFAASIKEAQQVASNKVRVKFDGLVGAGLLADAGTADKLAEILVLSQVGNATQPTISSISKVDNSTVELTVSNLDASKDLTVKTISQDYILATDANGKYYTANTTGVVASASGALVAGTLTATVANEENVTAADTFAITFNRLVDTQSIKAGWDGSEDAAATVRISETGELTVDGYAFGKISGFDVDSAKTLTNQKIAFSAATNTLTITIVGNQTTEDIVANGDLTYTGVNTVKSPSGLALDSTAKPVDTLDAAPVLLSATVGTDTGAAGFDEIDDTLVLTFSENVAIDGTFLAATGNAIGVINGILSVDVDGDTTPDALTSNSGNDAATFDVAVSGNTITVTIKGEALDAPVVAGTSTINIGTIGNSEIVDIDGPNDAVARNTVLVVK